LGFQFFGELLFCKQQVALNPPAAAVVVAVDEVTLP
jgi:hypothetical protein